MRTLIVFLIRYACLDAQTESIKAMGQSVQAGLASFWSGGRVLPVATALIERFLPLTAKDLQARGGRRSGI
jgi:hypothetical protein